MRTAYTSSISVVPASASPVLKTNLTIALPADFPVALDKASFSVNMTSNTDSSIVKYLNVIGVDDAAKTITALFGGAPSGMYTVNIRHSTDGLIDAPSALFEVGASVTSVSPKTGSIFGGTVLTITGTNFGTVYTDNPVSIVYNGAVGATSCFVQTTSATQITCKVDDTIDRTNLTSTPGTVVVFLRTSEEAPCGTGICDNYVYTSSVPNITSAATQYDSATNTWELKIEGTQMDSSAVLTVNGVA
jgi:hypothetical protein